MPYSLDDDDDGKDEYSSGGKDNLFGWTILILILIGVAFACWLGSFQIFGHPENPKSYAILKKLGKIEPPKRFELTKAPPGEFLTPKRLYDRYATFTKLELQRENDELMRNYLRNYTETKKLVPYVVGKYDVLESFDLKEDDFVQSGVIALAQPVDYPNILIEHLFPTSGGNVSGARANLVAGADLQLQKSLDLSAVVHIKKIYDGRLLFTVMPLLYGSYAVRQGGGGFDLEPPADLNLSAGAPVLHTETLQESFRIYTARRRQTSTNRIASAETKEAPEEPRPGLIRVEKPLQPDGTAIATPAPTPVETPMPVAKAIAVATPVPIATPEPITAPTPAQVALNASPTPPAAGADPAVPLQPFLVAARTPSPATSRGGAWKVYSPGQAPAGKVVDIPTVQASGDVRGERVYLEGDFVVTASGENRAVLRSRTGARTARVIVSFPNGSIPPTEGSNVSRGSSRPFQIMDVRQGADGQTNIYVREITAP